MVNCIFCRIIRKEMPAKIIYEDANAIVIDDIYPKAPIHKLIIPKKHITTINDFTEADDHLLMHLFRMVKKTAQDEGIVDNGYRVIANCNHDGGQAIFHVHFHLLGGKFLPW